jgi:hypothetical protein
VYIVNLAGFRDIVLQQLCTREQRNAALKKRVGLLVINAALQQAGISVSQHRWQCA